MFEQTPPTGQSVGDGTTAKDTSIPGFELPTNPEAVEALLSKLCSLDSDGRPSNYNDGLRTHIHEGIRSLEVEQPGGEHLRIIRSATMFLPDETSQSILNHQITVDSRIYDTRRLLLGFWKDGIFGFQLQTALRNRDIAVDYLHLPDLKTPNNRRVTRLVMPLSIARQLATYCEADVLQGSTKNPGVTPG